jgi:hypothetical protein
MSPRIVQRDAKQLAGTPKGFRPFEVACLVLFPIVAGMLAFRLRHAVIEWPLLVPLAGFTGLVGSDFSSGVAHWIFDTWGSPDTPIVGRTFIRTFREHHVDEKAITRHDFIETNGSNCLAGLAVLGSAFFFGDVNASRTVAFATASMLSWAFFIALTSQIHKWAHMDRPPRIVALLQHSRILLGPEHHSLHHQAPFERHYCITCGWLNQTLWWTGFFRVLERIVSMTTGALPRQDDIGKEAALAVAIEEGATESGPEPHPKHVD